MQTSTRIYAATRDLMGDQIYQFLRRAASGRSGLTVSRVAPTEDSVLPLKSPTRTDLAARIGRSPLECICII